MKTLKRESYLIGPKLKRLLEIKGISQRKLAKLTGYTQQYINAVVNNKTSVSLRALTRIAKALNVPVSYFFEDSEQSKEQVEPVDIDIKDIEALLQKLPPEKKGKLLKAFKEQLEALVEA